MSFKIINPNLGVAIVVAVMVSTKLQEGEGEFSTTEQNHNIKKKLFSSLC